MSRSRLGDAIAGAVNQHRQAIDQVAGRKVAVSVVYLNGRWVPQ